MAERQEQELAYNVLALSFSVPGAVSYFKEHLEPFILRESGKGHEEFYRALLAFYDITNSDPVDVVAFRSWLEEQQPEIYNSLGGLDGVTEYLNVVNHEVNLSSSPQTVCTLLRLRSNRQQQRYAVEKLADIVNSPNELQPDKIDALLEEIRRYTYSDDRSLETVSTGNVLASRVSDLWDLPSFLKTQFPSLNRALGYSDDGGFVRQSVNSIFASSGQGKSTLAKSLCINWLDEGYRVLYVNFEEPRMHWERILYTQITQCNIYDKDKVSYEDRERYDKLYRKRLEFWGDRLMVEHDPESLFYEDLEHWIRNVCNTYPDKIPDVIVIDTLPSLFLKSAIKAQRWVQFDGMIARLERLAKELNTVIIVTAQENRDRMKDGRKEVLQSDAGGSLTIVQKSTVAIFITRTKEAVNKDDIDENIMQLQIPKNRVTGMTYSMNPPLVKYVDSTKSYEPYDLSDHMTQRLKGFTAGYGFEDFDDGDFV